MVLQRERGTDAQVPERETSRAQANRDDLVLVDKVTHPQMEVYTDGSTWPVRVPYRDGKLREEVLLDGVDVSFDGNLNIKSVLCRR